MANNSRRRTITSGRSHSSEETVDTLKVTIVHLRSELDAERKCVRRLRREKTYEAQLAREQERNKAAMSVKEMTAKLHQEREQENENLRCKYKADIVKVMKQKDKEVNKIRKDLAKCQDDLKEEIFKCGLSTSARAAFELERSKLLQDIKELSASKKQVDDALSSALEAEKQRTNELRLLQETSRTEIAKVSKEANVEIKRLLDELKTKDHVVWSITKGNHSTCGRTYAKHLPDHRSVGLAELVTLSKEIETWQKRFSTIGDTAEGGNLPNFSLQRKLYEIEKQLKHVISVSSGFTEKHNELMGINKALEQRTSALVEKNNALNNEMKTVKGELRRLNGLMNTTGTNDLTSDLDHLQKQLKYYENKEKLEKRNFKPKKTVRFLLPFEDHEMCGGDDDSNRASYDDGGRDKEGDDFEMLDLSETVTATPADISDVEELTAKHLEMEHSYHQYKFSHEEQPKDWRIQNESLRIVIQTLEDKLKRSEEDEQKLKLKLTEVCDQNEELEFQILELENGTDEKKLNWQKENEALKSELLDLKTKAMQYQLNDIMERNVATQCDEEMLARDTAQQENSFHKLTDEYKLSLGAELEKSSSMPQCLSVHGQHNHESVPLHSPTTSESFSCLNMKIDTAEIESKTKIGAEQGSTLATCRQNANVIIPSDLFADEMLDVKQELCQNGIVSGVMPQVKSCDGDGEAGEGLMAHDVCRAREMEWMSEVESLKRKLNRSHVRECQMKDQLMLLEEEKNRQIKLLQHQMDLLEDDPIMSNQQTCLEMENPGTVEADNNRGERLMYGDELTPMNGERRGKMERIVRLKLDTALNWIATPTDVCMSTPGSSDFNFCPNLQYNDSKEEQLHQQVLDLERDRDLLNEIIQKDESIIYELQLEISKLQQSENDLQRIVDRLESAEEKMRRKTDDVVVKNDDMEKQIEALKESESMMLSNVRKMRSEELDLKMKLEEMVEENRSSESTWKRRLSEVEIEKRLLQDKVKELDEQVGDLEGTEMILKHKVKKMEKLEIHLRNEVEDVRRECNTLTGQFADLEFEKEVLMQRLEKQNLDFTTKVVHLKQEKEEMNVEMIEVTCRVKVLEQTLASKEAAVASLDLKLHNAALYEAELTRKLLAFENISQSMLIRINSQQVSGTNQESATEAVKLLSSDLWEFTGSENVDDCTDCDKGLKELMSSLCANDDQPVEGELGDDVSKDSLSLASCPSSGIVPADDVESADEASEIVDEDDGASPPDGCTTNPEDCWLILAPHPCTSFNRLKRLTESPSLDSINDSGLESLKQDGQMSGYENSVCHEKLLLTVKPNPYKHNKQGDRVSLIPISIRYLTKNTHPCSDSQNLACTVCKDTDSVGSQDSQDYIGEV